MQIDSCSINTVNAGKIPTDEMKAAAKNYLKIYLIHESKVRFNKIWNIGSAKRPGVFFDERS